MRCELNVKHLMNRKGTKCVRHSCVNSQIPVKLGEQSIKLAAAKFRNELSINMKGEIEYEFLKLNLKFKEFFLFLFVHSIDEVNHIGSHRKCLHKIFKYTLCHT